jgi:hypothetical protein
MSLILSRLLRQSMEEKEKCYSKVKYNTKEFNCCLLILSYFAFIVSDILKRGSSVKESYSNRIFMYQNSRKSSTSTRARGYTMLHREGRKNPSFTFVVRGALQETPYKSESALCGDTRDVV